MIRVLTQSLKIVSIAIVTLIVVVGSVAFFNYWSDRQSSQEIGQPVTIQITEEDDASSVADRLADSGLINYDWYFQARLRVSSNDLQPGTYTLRKGMSVSEIIDNVTSGNTDQASTGGDNATEPASGVEVTFIEGNRIEEDADAIVEAGWPGDRQAFIDAANDPVRFSGYSFLEGLPEGATLEGFLFPDTYTFGSDASADEIIQLVLTQFDTQFNDEMRQQATNADMSILEVVTLGSIVEREVQAPEELPIVAKLYENRLDQGMQLQTDPTLQYAVGTDGDWWPELNGDLIRQAQGNPYNTYEIPGLPPGPIASPGIAAMQGVLAPADVDYLYMVATADGTGTHLFTNDLNQHQQNICTVTPDADICNEGNDHVDPGLDLAWFDSRSLRFVSVQLRNDW